MALKALYNILVFNTDYKSAFASEGGETWKEKMKVYAMNKL